MKFIEVEQEGTIGRVNSDHILLILPTNIVGGSKLILINGLAVDIRGTVREIADRLNGEPRIV